MCVMCTKGISMIKVGNIVTVETVEKHLREILIFSNYILYLLLNGNLPVEFPGHRGPDNLTRIKSGVHSSQDEFSSILIGWLTG